LHNQPLDHALGVKVGQGMENGVEVSVIEVAEPFSGATRLRRARRRISQRHRGHVWATFDDVYEDTYADVMRCLFILFPDEQQCHVLLHTVFHRLLNEWPGRERRQGPRVLLYRQFVAVVREFGPQLSQVCRSAEACRTVVPEREDAIARTLGTRLDEDILLRTAFLRLSLPDASVLALKCAAGLTLAEIAQVLETSEVEASDCVHHVMERVQRLIDGASTPD